MREGWDEEQLLDAVREAMRARQAVPAGFVEVAKGAYAWHNIDAELAQLTYDPSREQDQLASIRSESASIRALTFTSPHLSIELEVTDEALIGQIIPAQEGTIEAQAQAYTTPAVPIDQIGCFAIDPIPTSPFRLHVHTDEGTDIVTGWITL